jgi:hypothetical protein
MKSLFVCLLLCLLPSLSYCQTLSTGLAYLTYVNATYRKISTQPRITPRSFPLYDDTVETKYRHRAAKAVNIGTGQWTTIGKHSGNSGVLKKVWLAVNQPPTAMFFNIKFDDVVTFGGNNSAPSINNGLAVDQVFCAGFAAYTPLATSSRFGCNNWGTGGLGGFVSFDMPFGSSFEIQLYNGNGNTAVYWLQYEFQEYPIGYEMTPLRFHMGLNVANGAWFQTMATYPNEYPLLSISSPNGVYLTYLKWFWSGVSGNWWEGRYHIYKGGPGMTATINALHYNDPGTYQNFTAYDSTATHLLVSSGTEDFFLSSWNFANNGYYAHEEAGYLFSSVGSTGPLVSNSQFSAYRVFESKKNNFPPHSLPNEMFVFSYAPGDILAGASGSGSWMAFIGYYS